MNLLALTTLTAIIKIEFCALHSIAQRMISTSRFHKAFHTLTENIRAYYTEVFEIDGCYKHEVNCMHMDKIGDHDSVFVFNLPCTRVFVLAYCVVSKETQEFQQFASKELAIKNCLPNHYVICKYCDPSLQSWDQSWVIDAYYGNTWIADIVYENVVNRYRVYLVPMSAPLMQGKQLQVNSTHHLYNAIDDETSRYQFLGDMYHNAIDTGFTGTWQETHDYCMQHYNNYRDDDISYSINTVNPPLSMLVLNILSQFEIACIEMLVFYMGMVWDQYDYDWIDCEYIADAIFNYRHDRYKHFGFNVHIFDEHFDSPIFALTA